MVYFSNIACIIFSLIVYCYYLFTCFKTVVFSCGLPINSFWFFGVSREIKNYLLLLLNTANKRKITLSYVICKEKDLDKRCPEIRTAPTSCTIIAVKETS